MTTSHSVADQSLVARSSRSEAFEHNTVLLICLHFLASLSNSNSNSSLLFYVYGIMSDVLWKVKDVYVYGQRKINITSFVFPLKND